MASEKTPLAGSEHRPSPATTSAPGKFWPEGWWRLMDRRVGIVPVPVFFLLVLVLGAFMARGKMSPEICVAMGVLAVGGCLFGEMGKRVPIVRHLGGAIIFTTFVPACLAHYGLLPAQLGPYVANFANSTKVLYLFIALITVGSIMSMDRTVLMRGFLKISVPLAAGSVVAAIVGTSVGAALGLGARDTFFYIVVPIMAGGVGEGAIPLSIGYSEILHTQQGAEFARVLPAVMFGSLTAVALAGLLNTLGKKYPHLTGEGRLQPGVDGDLPRQAEEAPPVVDINQVAAAGISIISLYLLGLLCHDLIGLPAPVAMLFIAVAVKVAQAASPDLQQGAKFVYKFTNTAFTFPMLFAVGLTFMPWDTLVAALAWRNLVTIACTVAALMATGFFVGRRVNIYPIEAAIVNACHSGQGSSGDVAILTAANRLQMMPFAQIATRIGGALTVTLALIALAHGW